MKSTAILMIAFILILLSSSFAADKSVAYPSEGILVFRGLDDTSSPTNVQDSRASAIQNVKLTRSLKLQKRFGYQTVNNRINQQRGTDYFPAVTGLYYTKLSTGTEHRYAVCANKVYYDNSGAWVEIGNVITYDQDYQFTWATALDTTILTNDVNVSYKITNGITFGALDVSDLSDTLTKVKSIAWFKNYLILANTVEAGTERPTRFRWSDVGTIETYQDDNFIDIAALGGQEINGMAQLYDNLYVFMTDSIWKVSLVGGDEIFVVSKVVDNVGCIAKNSIQSINLLNQRKGLVFLSKDKRVYFFDGTSLGEISILISNTLSSLNLTRLQYAVSAQDGSDYFLCVTDGANATSNNLLLDFQYEIGEWTKHIQIDANAMAKVVDSDSDTRIYFGNYASLVYDYDVDDLYNDVVGVEDGISAVGLTYDLADGTATDLTIIVTDTAIDYVATGATITITSGTGNGQEKVVIDQVSTGLIVDSAFTTTPDSSSLFSLGSIDASYTTKWYDLGEPARRKQISEMFLWADDSSGTTLDITATLDFNSPLSVVEVSLQAAGGLWDVGLWGDAVWGGAEALFKRVKLTDQGRLFKYKFSNSEIDQTFSLFGYKFIHWNYDLK